MSEPVRGTDAPAGGAVAFDALASDQRAIDDRSFVDGASANAAFDVVVIGSGLAGLSTALRLAEIDDGRRILIVTKTPALPGGSSRYAQGGMAAAVGPGDTPQAHARDTVDAAAGLGDPGAARRLTDDAPNQVRRLLDLGARFDRDERGGLALGREAAHGQPRILHAHGDATGLEIVRALVAAVEAHPAIHTRVDTFALDVVSEEGRVVGLQVLHATGRVEHIRARDVVLATGGLGQLYARTTNPRESTADGLAMAARAGARLVDVEFVQFHPTALDVPHADPRPLVTEALRGAGAVLIDGAGKRFMLEEHPSAELAPRDIVARAIAARIAAGDGAFLDARRAVGEAFPIRFPTVFALCTAHGIDPRVEAIPVTPATHYHMGGVAVDALGRTSVPGLWAGGEVASTGVHGANRLASNSLLEALVWGSGVAEAIATGDHAPEFDPAFGGPWTEHRKIPAAGLDHASTAPTAPAAPVASVDSPSTRAVSHPCHPTPDRQPESELEVRAALRAMAWQRIGLERDGAGLEAAAACFASWRPPLPDNGPVDRATAELRNLACAGRLVALAALERKESRGAHRRVDYPWREAAWRKRIALTVEHGTVRIETGPRLDEAAFADVVPDLEPDPNPDPNPNSNRNSNPNPERVGASDVAHPAGM